MSKRDYLMSLAWHDFKHYPPQFSTIYLHCVGKDKTGEEVHRFVKMRSFNAVNFSPNTLYEPLELCPPIELYWLPAQQIDNTL